MYISKVNIENFRLLKSTTLDLRQKLSYLIGRNNTGKTSMLVLFEKFLLAQSFHYNDFSLPLRNKIKNIDTTTPINELSIRMTLIINYDEKDNLENLSDLILDLDPDINTVKILFECSIKQDTLIKETSELEKDAKDNYIVKNLDRHLKSDVYIFDDNDDTPEIFTKNRHKLIKKELKDIKNLINLQIIHAKRNVSSSEENQKGKKTLSTLTTAYFNNENQLPNEDLIGINETLISMDVALGKRYESFFKDFLKNSKRFLNLDNLSVISNIQSQSLLSNSSEVIYGSDDDQLPENLNGLGFMNILFLLLSIEMKIDNFKKQNRDLNLLFIEEPEAHTHPQMQYIFANEIENAINSITNLQTLITSHSPHIVSHCNFDDIRYIKIKQTDKHNVDIKNFHLELKDKYTKKEEFKFIEQYLNIQSAELFFASKVIFIEGISERILLPYFIKTFDNENSKGKENYLSLASQNISILEVGANAKVFGPFLEFLDIMTLIITDIDTCKKDTSGKRTTYPATSVDKSTHTSNATIKHFLNAPDINSKEHDAWFNKLKSNSLHAANDNISLKYQKEENDYHARSFEDAFISINIETIKTNKDAISGLKNTNEIDTNEDIYSLTENIIDKKSDFAASLLYMALSDDKIKWKTPQYINDGLSWLVE